VTSTHWELVGDAFWISLTAFTAFDLALHALAGTGKGRGRSHGPIGRPFGEAWGQCRTGFAHAWVQATHRSIGARAFLRHWLTPLSQGTRTSLIAVSALVVCAAGVPATKAPMIAHPLDLAWLLTALLATSVALRRAVMRSFAIKCPTRMTTKSRLEFSFWRDHLTCFNQRNFKFFKTTKPETPKPLAKQDINVSEIIYNSNHRIDGI
jgi:hypothetical protein